LFDLIVPIIEEDPYVSTISAQLQLHLGERIDDRRDRHGVVNIVNRISRETGEILRELGIAGLNVDPYEVRHHPEGSMAAHVLGFVGKNEAGEDTGYFGVEGALNQELRARVGRRVVPVDARGRAIHAQEELLVDASDGRDITLTIRRDIQSLLEQELATAMRLYGARRGEIIVADPSTGKILGLATYPTYHPSNFINYPTALYRNPAVADTFEPGSTFKVLTVAAGIDAGVISPHTQCTNCGGPRIIDGWPIRTWNEVYHPNITMTEALQRSDNVAMVYLTDLLGTARFQNYMRDFGIGEALGVELEEDWMTPFPTRWGPVELAPRSFGQGIVVNSMQMVRAVGAIANGGWMMQPLIVERAVDPNTGEVFESTPIRVRQVISEQSARTVSTMMRSSARYGEAQFIYRYTEVIAGKTGTAQVARADGGGYYEDETIASFVGFAPYDNPRFVMHVKLEAPRSSPWAAETAAPLWNSVAERLFIIFNIGST
jgi:cell division protein FtsI/penicillin-binding protein 2